MIAASTATAFWGPWESLVKSLQEFHEILEKLFERWVVPGDRVFAWRGVADATWPLHSSLYRRLAATMTTLPDEAALAAAEKRILDEAHRWGLHQSGQGRLGALEQLAMLQHFGAPTRLVDVSFNPYIALWFAVEVDDPQDGRVFAIDVTQRLINEDDKMREWEPMAAVPWKTDQWWNSRALAWRPPPIERRIAAQHGAFLLGGVPTSSGPDGPIQWPKSTSAGAKWKIAEVRRFISVPLRMHKLDPGAGGVRPDGWPAYTFRVLGTAKSEIRMRLEKLFGFQHRTLFPDYPGFAKYATRGLFPFP